MNDTPTPTAAQIEELEGLIAKATPGIECNRLVDHASHGAAIRSGEAEVAFCGNANDAAYIRWLLQNLPALLAAAKRATAMEKALKPFAELSDRLDAMSITEYEAASYGQMVSHKDLRTARAALAAP